MGGMVESVYGRSPLWVQQIGLAAYGLLWRRRRFGGVFKNTADEFLARESLSADEWQAWQDRELRKLLQHSWDNVNHYRREFERVGLKRSDLGSMTTTGVGRLPILDKDAIRRCPGDFVSKAVSLKKLHTYHTSGTTGTPLAVLMSSETHQKVSAAYEVRCRRWAGLENTMSRAMIGGRLVVPKSQNGPPYWRFNPAERQLYMSAFHISPSTVADYVGELNRRKPDYLVGYASAHFFLARFIKEAGLAVHRPRAVLTSSEKLTKPMRDNLMRVYRCEVFDAYSGVEACCLISECEHHKLHVSPDVGLVEIVDERGGSVRAGEDGEIVATGFLNLDQPLIRYRTGDIARWSTTPCRCGRAMPVVDEIIGRIEDTVVGPDGRETVRFHGLTLGIPAIRECQVVQDSIGRIRLRVVADRRLDDRHKRILIRRVRERLDGVQVDVEETDHIERTSRGKFPAVVSKVERQR